MDPIDQDRAACAGTDPRRFFDEDHEDWAKAVCARCPVQEACLAHALLYREQGGVWGGLNEQERINRARSATATPGGAPLLTHDYTTRARSTGATCSAGATATGWGATCHTHGTTAVARSRTAAGYAVSRPEEWCPACTRIAAGLEPKVEKDP